MGNFNEKKAGTGKKKNSKFTGEKRENQKEYRNVRKEAGKGDARSGRKGNEEQKLKNKMPAKNQFTSKKSPEKIRIKEK